MDRPGSVVAIVNPAAGRSRGAEPRARAVAELVRLFPGLEVEHTESPGHGIELARRHAGAELVVAVGGDGTIREVASGLIGGTAEMAVVPVGSGNDFPKTPGIPNDLVAACRLARDSAPRPVDAGRIEVITPHGIDVHYFVNAAGFGFDARVVAETRKSKRLRGLPLYLAAVFRTISNYRCPVARIRTGNREWHQPVLLVAAANGRYYGGGMQIAPGAEQDSGALEFCIIDAIGRFTILRRLPSFVKGTHIRLKEVTMVRGESIELEFDEPVELQLDGDLLDVTAARRFSIRVIPGALRVRMP